MTFLFRLNTLVTVLFMALYLFVAPQVALADCLGSDGRTYADGHPACASQNSFQQTQTEGLNYSLRSPLAGAGISSLEGLLTAILNILMVIAIPVIVFFIIFAGFNYVTAQGNQEKIKTATRSLTYAIIGAILILGAVALSEIIAGVVSSFQGS